MGNDQRPVGHFHGLEHGAPYLEGMFPFDAPMLAWRKGPDANYFFFSAPDSVMWLPPDDFDWSRVVPGRILTNAEGRRWLAVKVFVACRRLSGDEIGPHSVGMPVNIAVITDERLADLDTIDFAMVEMIAVAHVTMSDPRA